MVYGVINLSELWQNTRPDMSVSSLMLELVVHRRMIIGNYLVTKGDEAAKRLVAAMVVSIPWNVFVGTESLERPFWNLMLNRHLARCLCDSVHCMGDILKGSGKWDLDSVMQVGILLPNEE